MAMAMAMEPRSCDTFVVLPPLTAHGGIVFAKNSDRPRGEVQELVYLSATDNADSTLECTYIKVDQVPRSHAVILSKPSWLWGAEMGANEHGVCIGNEAINTTILENDGEVEKLLGMDLVRLGLERADSAEGALKVMTDLLEKYGQGGPCSDILPEVIYHNSFLIADRKEAWILETAGTLWAAVKVTDGCRNISNTFSIGTKIDRSSDSLAQKAQDLGVWDGSGEFNFAAVFSIPMNDAVNRAKCGDALLKKFSAENKFTASDMMTVLRDTESRISRGKGDAFPTNGSQVSVLSPLDSGKPDCHWFTATPDPNISVFKPFIFTPNVCISHHTVSPTFKEDPAKLVPRFATTVDRAHTLYKLHEEATNENNKGRDEVIGKLRSMERSCVVDVEAFIGNFQPGQSLSEVDELLKDVVETEVKFYK